METKLIVFIVIEVILLLIHTSGNKTRIEKT